MIFRRTSEEPRWNEPAFTIWNDGPLPVTIESVGSGGDGRLSRHAVAYAADPYTGGHPRTTAPFSAFRLEPDAGAFLEMEVHVGNDLCLERDSYHGWISDPSPTGSSASRGIRMWRERHRDADRGEGRADARL